MLLYAAVERGDLCDILFLHNGCLLLRVLSFFHFMFDIVHRTRVQLIMTQAAALHRHPTWVLEYYYRPIRSTGPLIQAQVNRPTELLSAACPSPAGLIIMIASRLALKRP